MPQTSLATVSSTAPPGRGRGAGSRTCSSGRPGPCMRTARTVSEALVIDESSSRPGRYFAGGGITLGYRSSIPSSFITFSIASMSHGASFDTTSAPLSVMKIMSSSRT